MSYILDALKRSEQDRHQTNVANLSNDMMMLPSKKASRALWPYFMLLIVVLNGGAYVYFYATSEGDIQATEQNANELERKLRTVTQNINRSEFEQKAIPKHLSEKPKFRPKIENSPKNISEKFRPSSQENQSSNSYDGELIVPNRGLDSQTTKLPMPIIENTGNKLSNDIAGNNLSDNQVSEFDQSPDYDVLAMYPHLSEQTIQFQRSIPKLIFNSHIYSDIPDSRRVMINNLYLREGQGFSEMTLLEIGEFYIAIEKDGTSFKIPVLRDWLGG